jgi:hypothetical protein
VAVLALGTFVSDTGSFVIRTASADTLRGTFDLTTSAFLLFGNVTADSVEWELEWSLSRGESEPR